MVEANESYYGGAPSIPRVTILNMEPDAAMASARTGELDLVMADTNYVNEEIEGMHLEELDTMDVRQISLPVSPAGEYETDEGTVKAGNNVTADPAVREALDIAYTDRR